MRLRAAAPRRGFTLLEVMIGLALLGLALTVLLKSAANSIFSAQQAQMMGVVTELARGKMYDIEEMLQKDGFTESSQSKDCPDRGTALEGGETFEDEGWPKVRYGYCVEQVELPGWETLQAMAKGQAGAGSAAGSGAGSGVGSDVPAGGFQDSALGGMLSMMGGGLGGGGGDVEGSMGAAFIQGQYQMVSDVLKASIRKVTLHVAWEVLGSKREIRVVSYFTDAASMDKVLSGLGSQEPTSGTGTGTGSGTTGGRTGGTGRGGKTE